MALFYYQALERNGRKTKGMIEADSARHARQLLRGKELIPVHIEARMNTSSGGMLQRRRHAHRRVAAADLALFTRQLATLVQAAMPLETCLQAVSEQSEKLHVKSLGMALLYLMTREQRAVRQQGESDMAGSRWYWRTTPLSTGNALLQAVDIEVSLHEDFSSVIQSRRAWFSAVGGQQ